MRRLIVIFCFLHFGLQAQHIQEYWLQSRMNGVYELDNGTNITFWGYGDNTPPNPGNKVFLPGPTLRFKEADSAVVHFKNNSPEMHTIHFHGLDVLTPYDGVPHTSVEIAPNATFDYRFKCKSAGTFLYHCHVLTTLHLAMGMYGMVIVDPPGGPGILYTNGPSYVQEYPLLASEFDLDWNTNPMSPGPFQLYEANYVMINGKSGSQLQDGTHDITGVVNTPIALRLANIGYGKVNFIFPNAVQVQVYASDGRPLPASFSSSILQLFPGERYDVIIESALEMDAQLAVVYEDLRDLQMIGQNSIPLRFSLVGLQESNSQKPFFFVANPTTKDVQIQNQSQEVLSLQVRNLQGQHLFSFQAPIGISTMQLDLPAGTYLVQDQHQHLQRLQLLR